MGTVQGKMYRVLTNDLSFLLHSDAHVGSINDVSFGANSDWFVSVDEAGNVKTWDLSEYKSIFTTTPAKSGASSCFVAKDDETILTGWKDGFIRCFNPATKSLAWEVVGAHRGSVTALYADQNYILSGGQDGAVRIWARASRKLLIQFNGKFSF